jgi:hypothetical protein
MVLFFWRSVEFKYQPRWQRLKVMVVAFFVYFFHFRYRLIEPADSTARLEEVHVNAHVEYRRHQSPVL